MGSIGTGGDGRIPDLPSLPKILLKKYLGFFSFEDASRTKPSARTMSRVPGLPQIRIWRSPGVFGYPLLVFIVMGSVHHAAVFGFM